MSPGRTHLPSVATCALLPLLVAACTTARTPGAASPAPPSSTPTPAHRTASVTPPELDAEAGETLAGRHPATRGNGAFAYSGGPQGKALVLAVSCQGEGTITVQLPVMASSYRPNCDPGTPAVTYNQLVVPEASKPGTVTVTAPTTTTWSVTVGRTDPTPTDA
ncbi:hypothetical protein ACIHCM_06030 [Streptomyces sp. NPDC052023]|uniref:hypothetical protein n=1 Tax=Streptomyces sp. NPDC052023 TaxID=3365681 RepID=UPI0037D8802A